MPEFFPSPPSPPTQTGRQPAKDVYLSMTREPLVIQNPGYHRQGSNHKQVQACFVTVNSGFGELSICASCSKSRDLQSEHGFRACSFQDKGNKLDFHTFWDQRTETKTEKWDEIGRILVPGALNRSKKLRKTGADNFPKSSACKTEKKHETIYFSSDFSPFSCGSPITRVPEN